MYMPSTIKDVAKSPKSPKHTHTHLKEMTNEQVFRFSDYMASQNIKITSKETSTAAPAAVAALSSACCFIFMRDNVVWFYFSKRTLK